MANAYTATELLASLKRRGLIPTSASTFTTADFLKVVDEEIQTYIVPLLLQLNEEYLVVSEDVTIVAGTTWYYVPERAIGSKLRDVTVSDNNGGFRPLVRYEPENIGSFPTSNGFAEGYYLQGNKIFVVPTPGSSTTMRLTYFQRPNRMVATTAVAQIGDWDDTTLTLEATAPSTFVIGGYLDIVKGKPGFDTVAKDLRPSGVSGDTLTFQSGVLTAEILAQLSLEDYVCLTQESPIPQIPVELHPLLAQRCAATILQSLGDAKAKTSYQVAKDMEERLVKTLEPRVDGSSRVVVNKFGVGQGRYRYRRW